KDRGSPSALNSRRFRSDGAEATARETAECAVVSQPIPDHWSSPLHLHNAPGPSITPELPGSQKGCPIGAGRDPVDTDPHTIAARLRSNRRRARPSTRLLAKSLDI